MRLARRLKLLLLCLVFRSKTIWLITEHCREAYGLEGFALNRGIDSRPCEHAEVIGDAKFC